jgi:hypothetical protein
MCEVLMQYAPVLERVVNLVLKDAGLRYGDALNQAMRELDIAVPEAVQAAILRAALRISVNGFPTTVKA